ncbi:MAG: DUF4352 domain-containing protein [Desulfurococcales archaeon]|nr:DUF4352 domain-containing protein [Desulfurococcales archaeon]
MRRGISPVIATVIIVAVAIAISIAVAGWLMGLWGGFGQTESLKIFPDSYVNSTTLVLHIQNTGGSAAEIYKIELSGTTLMDNNAAAVGVVVNGNTVTTNTIVVDPGQTVTIEVPLTTGFNTAAGVAYTVTVYTQAGNVYTSTVYGK